MGAAGVIWIEAGRTIVDVGAECIEDEEGKGRTTRVNEAILNWRQVQHEQLVNSIQPVQLA